MKTRYKFIHFAPRADDADGIWECCNNRYGDLLGKVSFDKQWKQWIFVPEYGSIFSRDCLEDIISFTKQLSH